MRKKKPFPFSPVSITSVGKNLYNFDRLYRKIRYSRLEVKSTYTVVLGAFRMIQATSRGSELNANRMFHGVRYPSNLEGPEHPANMDVRRICQLLITGFVSMYFLLFYAGIIVFFYILWIG